jgi:hypothetical protein
MMSEACILFAAVALVSTAIVEDSYVCTTRVPRSLARVLRVLRKRAYPLPKLLVAEGTYVGPSELEQIQNRSRDPQLIDRARSRSFIAAPA